MMKHIHYARKTRQLKNLVNKLELLIHDNRGHVQGQIIRLVKKIRALIKELSHVIAPAHLKRILGSVAVIIGISFAEEVSAQPFAAPVANPFGLDSTYTFAIPAFADLDGDGDLDLLVGEAYGAMQYFENTGMAKTPQFAAPIANPFGLDSTYYHAFPAFADLDGDGDLDLLVGEYYGTMQYFENTGTAQMPQFASPVVNPFGLDSTYYIAFPAFADLDGDGDLDLLVGEYYGAMQYFENTGTAQMPQFAAPVVNPFGLDSTYYYAFPAFADLDGDGDLDLLVGEYYGAMQYFENTGTAQMPQFTAPVQNPFGLTSTYYLASPAFADLDGDSDLDLLVGEAYGAMQYFENTDTTAVGVNEPFSDMQLKLFPNPARDVINIQSDKIIDKIEVFDAIGKLVATYENNPSSVTVNHLIEGIYLFKFFDKEGRYAVKRVQKH